MYSYTEENYLKAIYFLSDQDNAKVSTNALAAKLNTKAASVTDMLKRLSEKELLKYKKYQGVRLTDQGMEVATRTVRKHRLWEVFLVEKLNFGWDEVHEMAEQLEHIHSPELTNRLESFLGFPKFDPHGDPIPDKNGVLPTRSQKTLGDCQTNDRLVVEGVKDSSSDFLRFLEKQDIGLGTQLYIVEVEEFDGSITAKKGNTIITLSKQVSFNLYVKLL